MFNKSDLEEGMILKHRRGFKSIMVQNIDYPEGMSREKLLADSEEFGERKLIDFSEELEHHLHDWMDVVEVRVVDDAASLIKDYIEDEYGESNVLDMHFNQSAFIRYASDEKYDELKLIWKREE